MSTQRRGVLVGVSALLAGCGADGEGGPAGIDDGADLDAGATGSPTVTTDGGEAAFSLSSPAIESGGEVPRRFTADGADVSPSLSIDGVPPEAGSLALVVDDPDAPTGPFVHWLLWNLPPDTTSIPEDVPQSERVADLDARQGTNDFGEVGYRGPAPPAGDDPHRYRFTAAALDAELDLEASAGLDRLADAMDGRVVARAEFAAVYGR